MASQDQMWFEIGVRDKVSKELEAMLKRSENIDDKFREIMGNLEGYVSRAAKSAQRASADAEKFNGMIGRIKKGLDKINNRNVVIGVKTDAPVAIRAIESQILELTPRLNEVGKALRETMAIQSKDPSAGNLQTIRQLSDEYYRMKSHIEGLYVALDKFSGLSQKVHIGNLEHVRDDAERSAEKHASRRRDIEAAFAADEKKRMQDNADAMRVEEILQMNRHRMSMEQRKLDHENAAAAREVNETLRKNRKEQEAAAAAARENQRASEGLVRAYDNVTAAGNRQSMMMRELTSMASSYFSLYTLRNLARDVITKGGDFEVQHVALKNILGDLQEANRLFVELKGLALESPMTFRQLAGYTKQLAAFSIPSDELFDTTKRLADLSTGLGVDMSRLILAYGQVRSAAVLRGQELRQFTEAGIPLVKRLAEEFTRLNGTVVKTGDVFELISKRKVPFEMVQKILWDMTDEGGQFYDMQSTIAETLAGKWQKLSDAYEQFLGRLADGNTLSGQVLKSILTTTTDLINNLEKVLPLIGNIVAFKAFQNIGGRGISFLTGNAATIEANIRAAQRQNAVEIQREYTLGRIKKSRMDELLLQNQSLSKSVQMLAQSGRLTMTELASLKVKGSITDEDIKQLVLQKAITAEEGKQLMSMTKMKMLRMQINDSIGGFFSKGNLWMMGFALATTAVFSFVGHLREANEVAKELREEIERGAGSRLDSGLDLLAGMQKPSTITEYADKIEVLSQYLRENAASWSAVDEAANSTDGSFENIKNRYEELVSRVEAVNAANEKLKDNSGIIGDADDASGVNWWIGPNREISGILKKTQKYYEDFSKSVSNVLAKNRDGIRGALKEIVSSYGDFAKAVEDRNLQDNLKAQLELLREFPAARDAMSGKFKELGIYESNPYNIVKVIEHEWGAAERNIEDFANFVKNSMQNLWDSIKFNNLTDEQREYLERMLADFQKKHGISNTWAVEDLRKKLNEAGFNIPVKLSVHTEEEPLRQWQQRLIDLTGQEYVAEIKAFTNVGQAVEFFKKKVKELKDEMENSSPVAVKFGFVLDKKGSFIPGPNAQQVTGAGTFQVPWQKTAGALAAEYYNSLEKTLSGVITGLQELGIDTNSLDKKKGGRSGGSKEDKVLKGLKERFDEVKSFYAEYKKYKEVYGKERSIDILEGLFPSLQGRGREIVDGYEGVLAQIAADMEKRPGGKKVALTVRKLLADIDLDKVKDDLKEQLKAVEKFIQEETSKWNLYKGLLEKTGDKSFAMTAFTDGVLWDDMTHGLEARLRELMSARGLSARGDLFGMDADEAEKFFGAGTAELKLWEEIVKGIRKNWSDGLNEVAAATEKLLTAEEKVLKAERELADLRSKYGNNDPRAIAKEQEVGRLAADAFEQSEPYLRFYSAILSMTLDEAEKAGAAIKENLVKQLADGTINADKYLKSIKNVNQQLKLVRDKRSDAMTLLRGGVSGLIDKRKKVAEDEAAGATIQVEAASKEVLAARKNLYEVEKAGNSQAIIAAKLRLSLAEAELDRLSGVAQKKQQYLQDILGFEESMSDVAAVVDMVAGAFDGFSKAAMQVSEMLDALGHEGSAETWSDISDTIGAIGSPISAAANALKSALSGDVGGFISNTVGIFTAPITAFAKLHDKKRQREIEKSEQRVRALTTSYQNLQTAMESALGGIYTSGGYDEMFGNLKKQRDEIQHQMELEDDKKKTDADKMADYRQQLKELDAQIKDYALNMAKSLYDIDLKAWASQLTDAIVSAWENGEDAVEAYRSKVKEIVKDLTKNILAKKVMENAFKQLGIDNLIASMMDASSGKLDETMLPRLAEALGKVGNITVDAVTKSLDAAERQGMIERGTEKTSSASNTIKGISEQTADLLASYINAIRADVSVNRVTLLNILYALQGQTEMPAVARAQLQQLEIIATNTGITAENTAAINEIYAILQANVNGINYFRIK